MPADVRAFFICRCPAIRACPENFKKSLTNTVLSVIVVIAHAKEVVVIIIRIDPVSVVPIYEQLYNQVICGIASGKLGHGEVLPSVRSLGADLGINFHTVNKAYTMLCDEGYIIMNRRQGAVVLFPVSQKEKSLSKMTESISLSAAKAVCHDMNQEKFIELCKKCYQQVKEGVPS